MDWLLSGSSLGLWVPSFIEPQEMNLLINPAHHQYSAVKLIVERRPSDPPHKWHFPERDTERLDILDGMHAFGSHMVIV